MIAAPDDLPTGQEELISYVHANKLEMLYFDKTDVLLRFFCFLWKKYSSLSPFYYMAGVLLPIYIAAYFEDVLYNPNIHPDLINDIGIYGLYYLAVPVLIAFTVRWRTFFPRIFYTLYFNKNINSSKDEVNIIINKWNNILSNRRLNIIIYAFSVLTSITSIYFYSFTSVNNWHKPSWYARPTTADMIQWFAVFVACYIIVQAILRVVLSYLFMIDFFRNISINIQMLHPDKCGGLNVVGKFSLGMNFMVLLIGVFVTIGLYSNMTFYGMPPLHVENVMLLFGYLLGSFFIVFTPLISVHNKMRKVRQAFLKNINLRFESEYQNIKSAIYQNNKIDKSSTEEIKSLRELHDFALKQPVWPFNFTTVYSFLGSTFTPFAFTAYKVALKIHFDIKLLSF